MEIVFEIPNGDSPYKNQSKMLCSLNEYTKVCRGNKGYLLGNEMKKRVEEHIAKHVPETPKFDDRVFLTCEWYESNVKRDPDNVCFAKKMILDTLTKLDVLENDNIKFVAGFTDLFYIDKENPRVVVKLTTEGVNYGKEIKRFDQHGHRDT